LAAKTSARAAPLQTRIPQAYVLLAKAEVIVWASMTRLLSSMAGQPLRSAAANQRGTGH
jgi:hypothetical protein